jgi:predicted transcriptional regulator
MAKQSTIKGRRAPIPRGKATTFRLDPSVRQAMLQLQTVLKKPLNRLVNEALQDFIKKLTVESDLQHILTRVRANRRSDPKFDNAIAQFVDAEASLGANDPVEGQTQPKAGPMQTIVRDLLRG